MSPDQAPRAPRPLEEIERIEDPAEQARAAVEFTAYAEHRARQGRAIRDQALRELQRRGVSKPKISAATGVNIATVKAVLR